MTGKPQQRSSYLGFCFSRKKDESCVRSRAAFRPGCRSSSRPAWMAALPMSISTRLGVGLYMRALVVFFHPLSIRGKKGGLSSSFLLLLLPFGSSFLAGAPFKPLLQQYASWQHHRGASSAGACGQHRGIPWLQEFDSQREQCGQSLLFLSDVRDWGER